MGKCLKCNKKVLGSDVDNCNNCNEYVQNLIQAAIGEDVWESEEDIVKREQIAINILEALANDLRAVTMEKQEIVEALEIVELDLK